MQRVTFAVYRPVWGTSFPGKIKLIKHYSWRRTVNSRLIWSPSTIYCSFSTSHSSQDYHELHEEQRGSERWSIQEDFFFLETFKLVVVEKLIATPRGTAWKKSMHCITCANKTKIGGQMGARRCLRCRMRCFAVLEYPSDLDCSRWYWMWILDCRQPTKRVGGTCLDISVTLCIILSVQQMPVFRISMWRAATVPELATVPTLSLPFQATSDMSQHEMRPPTDAITLLPRLLTITKNRWDWNLSVVSLLIIGRTPKLLVSTEGSGFAFQVICAKCERLYFKRAEPSTRPAGPAWCGFEPRARYHDGGLRYEMTH